MAFRMDLKPLPSHSPLHAYEVQAEHLLAAHKTGDADAIALFHRRHPRFLDETIKWKPKPIPASEIRDAVLTADDARLAIARHYDFLDWAALAAHVDAVSRAGPVRDFEAAVKRTLTTVRLWPSAGIRERRLRRSPLSF
jgi:hypothetical protein